LPGWLRPPASTYWPCWVRPSQTHFTLTSHTNQGRISPSLGTRNNERLVIYCRATSASTAHALRIVLLTVPRGGRSYGLFADGFDLHLLQAFRQCILARLVATRLTPFYSHSASETRSRFTGVTRTQGPTPRVGWSYAHRHGPTVGSYGVVDLMFE